MKNNFICIFLFTCPLIFMIVYLYFYPLAFSYKFGKKSFFLCFLQIPYFYVNYSKISEVIIIPFDFFKHIKICISQRFFSVGNLLHNRLTPNCVVIYVKLFFYKGFILTPEKPEEFVAELNQRIELNKIKYEKNSN